MQWIVFKINFQDHPTKSFDTYSFGIIQIKMSWKISIQIFILLLL